MSDIPRTLQGLLASRAQENTTGMYFLDLQGNVAETITYANLYSDAVCGSQRLLASGLKPGSDIVIAIFADHKQHIRLFWSCCFAGIPICPIPPFHPDPSRRAVFFAHLQSLFCGPVVITDDATVIDGVKAIAPELRVMSWATLSTRNTDSAVFAPPFHSKPSSPDDIVCLMLTSGSTGNSKAVAHCHSSLLSAVRGKVKCHGTTTSSRFLNWIVFDHVACVTEVHLHALAANARQYHVIPSAVIQRPRGLLEWCSRYQITYTFSPNFLIAQLCRDVAVSPYELGALDLSALVAFISGGEAVPIKTAVAFADLLELFGAPRNALRVGFGMSETAAGCVYNTRPVGRDEHPSTEKYLSLGQCCPGTTLRVVSPYTGDVCGPLESGKLQLKGPTVFREYYNNVEATAESFTADGWFITGDSAMVDNSGDLYLVGRDKDQVNINGVKHPSVDIEHFVEDSDIEGVMCSFVFVCPMRLADSDTDTYSVFYQHSIRVEDELSEGDVAVLRETNHAIRNCCIVICSQAPHVVLPLPRRSFSKTALGKVSRSSLMVAYLGGEHNALVQRLLSPSLSNGSAAKDEPSNAVEEIVFEAVADLTHAQRSEFTRGCSLFALGVTSMHLVQLKHRLQRDLQIRDIPVIAMLRHPQLGQLCDYLRKAQESVSPQQEPRCYHPLVPLRPRGSMPPIFLVHPGVGEVLVFVNLVRALHRAHPLYALRARGFDPNEDVFESFEEMVAEYVAAVETHQPAGPYYLGGYSFGGAVAFEMAKVLEAKGKRVAWVGILNLPPFIKSRMDELTWTEVLLNLFMFISLVTPSDLEATRSQLHAAFPGLPDSTSEPANGEQVIDWLLSRSDQERLSELQLGSDELRRWVRVACSLTWLGRTYQPSPLVRDALVTVFCATPLASMGTREQYKSERLSQWQRFCTNLELVDVDGEHYTMLSDTNIDSFARTFSSALDRASARSVTGGLQKLDFESVPIVDFSLARTDSPRYYDQLRFALEDVGFCVFVNIPGFEGAFQHELFGLAERLFNRPQQWKDALGTSNSCALRGYFRADDIPGPHKAYAEAYRFGLELPAPEGDDIPFWLKLHEGPNQWPPEEDLPKFRELMQLLFSRYHALNLSLNSHICHLLDIPPTMLGDYFPQKTEFNCAIWHYLPVTPEIRASAQNGFAQGMHEHRDPSTFLTCLIQSRPGLQVQNHAGRWIDVPMVEGGVVCNIGMQLMKLTGGKLVATTHRVNTLRIEKDRYTIPYVLSTKLEKAVVPLPQFTCEDAAKYHVAPNAKILKLMSIADPLERSGYARLSLFPAATRKLYPKEYERAHELGLM
ncbi:uncharacterized protein PHACADRAFT_197555 [Phanerochaete carnosa HHB-10118-sp]|uniref:Carrier domain-containing protein n=1 Tax=Phanerochaete carnosa (strain HHB-10118-sp) TaxID=650164 RepID=K5W1X8_PHACS|nr:uncharacterized protein PHACADRAFT_197555 [Phanerochaete carnosa HHB-10118-sp]EKM53130.1 hypothetical protein PHACADRAFT_197555 [Phanerochaete carnosa HHB-10118-sp]